jgi:hypothetical protein
LTKKCILGNPILEKTYLKGESSLFFSYWNANINKEKLTMEFPSTLWLLWILRNHLLIFHSLKNLLLDALLNHETNTILNNGTASHPSGLVLNIVQYPSRVRVLTSSTLN